MPTALVTGASSGMGKATAKKLLEKGHTVYVAARRVDQMRDLEELGAIVLAMDITKAGDVVAAFDRITSDHAGGRRIDQQRWLRLVRRGGRHPDP